MGQFPSEPCQLHAHTLCGFRVEDGGDGLGYRGLIASANLQRQWWLAQRDHGVDHRVGDSGKGATDKGLLKGVLSCIGCLAPKGCWQGADLLEHLRHGEVGFRGCDRGPTPYQIRIDRRSGDRMGPCLRIVYQKF